MAIRISIVVADILRIDLQQPNLVQYLLLVWKEAVIDRWRL